MSFILILFRILWLFSCSTIFLVFFLSSLHCFVISLFGLYSTVYSELKKLNFLFWNNCRFPGSNTHMQTHTYMHTHTHVERSHVYFPVSSFLQWLHLALLYCNIQSKTLIFVQFTELIQVWSMCIYMYGFPWILKDKNLQISAWFQSDSINIHKSCVLCIVR